MFRYKWMIKINNELYTLHAFGVTALKQYTLSLITLYNWKFKIQMQYKSGFTLQKALLRLPSSLTKWQI
jgi:hypothetical protein